VYKYPCINNEFIESITSSTFPSLFTISHFLHDIKTYNLSLKAVIPLVSLYIEQGYIS